MAQKYTVSTSSSSTDRLSGVQIATVTLSDGTVVWVDWDPAATAFKLRYTNSRTAVDGTIATLSGLATAATTRPSTVVVAVDSSDNIYVAGMSSASISKLQLQAFVKGTGHTWTTGTATIYDGTGSSYNYTSLGAKWCNTGGGTSGGGHLLIAAQDTGAANKDFQTFDAGLLLTTLLTTISEVSHANQVVTNVGSPAGFDMASDGLGSTTVVAVFPHSVAGVWHLSSVAVSGSGVPTVTSINTFTVGSAAPATGQRARIIRYASNAYVALVVDETTGAITGRRCSSTALVGTAAAMGTITDVPNFHSSPLLWDAFFDPSVTNKVWVICRSSATANKLYRIGCAVASSVAWDAGTTADDTSVGTTISNLRVNKIPAVPYADWHVQNFDGVNYELYGDYTVFQAPPLAPTLTAPANASYQDLQAGFTFTWTYNPAVIGNTQTAYALRRKISGAGSYEWWNAGTGAWQGTEIFNTSASSSLTFAASKWTDGNIYNWSVNTQDAGGTGVYASDFTVTASAPPTVVVSAPSGTFASSSPTVTWSDTLQSGASQTSYRVVVESGTYGTTPGSGTTAWDSGVVSSAATTTTTGATLVNGTTYRWFVQVAETGGQTSVWGFSTATASFTPPTTPTLTATLDLPNARTTLVLTNNDAGSVSLGIIEVSDDGGTTWNTVRGTGAIVLAPAASVTVYDYEGTPSIARRYRARVSNVQGGGQIVASANATAGPVTMTLTTWWVKDIQVPANNLSVCDAQENSRTRPGDSVAVYPSGRVNPVVLKGPAHGATSKFRTIVKTEADRTAAMTLFTTQDDILVQDPRGRQWYAEWVGELTETQLRVDQPYYAIERGWVEVDVPG